MNNTNTHKFTLSYTTIHNPVALQNKRCRKIQEINLGKAYRGVFFIRTKKLYYKRRQTSKHMGFWYLVKYNRYNFFSKYQRAYFRCNNKRQIFAAKV